MLVLKKFFSTFDEFKELFGLRECGNGNISRSNKIFLNCLKDKEFITRMWKYANIETPSTFQEERKRNVARCFFEVRNMNQLKDWLKDYLYDTGFLLDQDKSYMTLRLSGWDFYHDNFMLDANAGICVDGYINCVRYVHRDTGEVKKMKCGKLLKSSMAFYERLPESLVVWAGECFCEDWSAHVVATNNNNYTLVVDEDFKSIYSANKCGEEMGSCMGHYDGDQSSFYNDAVFASAASLRNDDGIIVSRCIIWNEVFDDDGNRYRLAERQYSERSSNILKRQLITSLINGGYIDGYKNIGVSCHDNTAYLSNSGKDWSDKNFSIKCFLEPGDTLSYQDSFVYYDINSHVAYNHENNEYSHKLNTTDDHFIDGEEKWSEYHNCYIDGNDAVFVSRRDDWFYEDECVSIDGDYEFEDDCVRCDHCEEYVLCDDALWSDITENHYCCSDCLEEAERRYKEDNWYYSSLTELYYENEYERDKAEEEYKEENWYYSDWDEEYYEDEDMLTTYNHYDKYSKEYEENTILKESLSEALAQGYIIFFKGEYYDEWEDVSVPYGFEI